METPTPKTPKAFTAMMTGRCPVCREGALFTHPWHSRHFTQNHPRCPVCDADFEPEPGFLYGAMYVSYSLNVATMVAVSLFIYVLFNPESPFWYIGGVIGVTLLGLPFIFRLSRMVWVYVFGGFRYDPTAPARARSKRNADIRVVHSA
jgi:uncharacterized protein (DUF983 family)